VRFRETGRREPLMRGGNKGDDLETGGYLDPRTNPGGDLLSAWAASGLKGA